MTALSRRKTRLTFETDNVIQGRALVVEPRPLICVLRRKGTRVRYAINWKSVYIYAAEIAALTLRAQRKIAREARKAGRK